jgi:hypothetical protein
MAKDTINTDVTRKELKNPSSLVFLLTMIRTDYAKQTQGEFAKTLQSVGRRFRRGVSGRKTLGNIERNDEFIAYVHLENYRDYVGVPMGLLLLFSRMLANKRNKDEGKGGEDNRQLAENIMEIMQRVASDTVFDINELKAWKAILDQAPLLDRHDP